MQSVTSVHANNYAVLVLIDIARPALYDADEARASADAVRRADGDLRSAWHMVTYEDITEMFLEAAEATGLSVRPEFWRNSHPPEREVAGTFHPGHCQDA